jgi:hypothetical protein
MPALFAYLIAVGLLLGGGYGALNWLAAPEPVKVVAKAKAKSPPHHEASFEATPFEASSLAINDNNHAVPASTEPSSLSQSEANVAASEEGARPQPPEPSQVQQTRAAHAEVSPAESKQEVRQAALAVSPAQPAASTAPATAARQVKRPRLRQAGRRSEKSTLALMTLRTIEFPDGRRVTQLIPYRGGERALAFQPDE